MCQQDFIIWSGGLGDQGGRRKERGGEVEREGKRCECVCVGGREPERKEGETEKREARRGQR